jgi:ParB/RepB/Spo0J family partition protein
VKLSKPLHRAVNRAFEENEMTIIEENGQKLMKKPRVTRSPTPKLDELIVDEIAAQQAELRRLVSEAPVTRLALAELADSPFLKRKTWGNLDELAASIRSTGILENLLARPAAKGFELVFGHRRKRAAIKAEALVAPVKVVELSDAQVVELQAIENAQRTDLHPLEEAEEYEQLVKVGGIRPEDIGVRIGKSRSHVYGRLKLLNLCPEARKAFAAGDVLPSVALYIARLPHAKLQLEALKHLKPHYKDSEPTSAREAFRVIENRFMLRLADAPFDRSDAALLPAAGSCTDCGKRTGNQKELFSDVASGDVCTDPTCFASKRAANEKAKRRELEGTGVRVLESKPRPYGGAELPSGFERLDEKHHDYANKKVDGKTAAELMKAAEIVRPERVVTFDEKGKVVELVPAAAVAAAVRKLSPKKKAEPSKASGPKYSPAEKEAIASVHETVVLEIIKKASAKPGSEATWLLLALATAPYAWKTTSKLRGAKLFDYVVSELVAGGSAVDENLTSIATVFGIDLKKREKVALDQIVTPAKTPKPKKGART